MPSIAPPNLYTILLWCAVSQLISCTHDSDTIEPPSLQPDANTQFVAGQGDDDAEAAPDLASLGDIAPVSVHAPHWVSRGSGVLKTDDGAQPAGTTIVAVASVKGVANAALARASAANRARAKLAMILARRAGEPDRDISVALRQVSVEDYWQDRDGRLFARAQMTLPPAAGQDGGETAQPSGM